MVPATGGSALLRPVLVRCHAVPVIACCRFLGLRLKTLSAWEYNRMFMFKPKTISTVAFVLAAIFASRCLWNFLTFAEVIAIDIE